VINQPVPSGSPQKLLDVEGLAASYGQVEALKPTSFHIEEGELVTMLGPNGAGKTTLLRAVTGLIKARGHVRFRGHDLTSEPTHQYARHGVVMVQEGRGLFGAMTVKENLRLGAYSLSGDAPDKQREIVFTLFPRLKERYLQVASSLSGGEQQMLAIGRAFDEPSLGLAPRVASEILETLGALNKQGLGILLVEQKAPLALKLAKRAYVVSLGRIAAELAANEIKSHHDLAKYYLH
jgi:branched-chain amino acid transport system ATP-binding protein